ncbi:MAG: ATP-binding cassette domain-containing protein [candidate division Zixibacteria bacterium]|nr:ATP-binding cassette domain-containing protein [candidate division Zixibacteria bacterium]
MLDKIKWFWQYYRPYKYVLSVLLILTPIQIAFQVSIPRLVEFGVDYVKTGNIPGNPAAKWLIGLGQSWGLTVIASLALTLILLGIIASLLYAFVQSHRAWMNMRLDWAFRQKAFDGITKKGPDFFNRFRTGDLVTRMTDDVEQKLAWFACSGIFRLYEALLMVSFTLSMMVMIDPILTLYTAGPLPILIIIFFKSASLLEKRYDHLQSRISNFNDTMEACFSGIRVVKSYVREKSQKAKFEEALQDRREAEIAAIKTSTVIDSLYNYIWQFGVVIVVLAGGLMVINAGLSVGKLVAFVYYTVYLVFPMFDIGQFLVKSRQSAVSIDRLQELEKVPPVVTENGSRLSVDKIEQGLRFEKVSFGFNGNSSRILDNVDLEIPAGSTVALVGKVGAGKSWLVNLIPRLVDPTGGMISLDGHDLKKYRLANLRRLIGYVPQEPVLFSDTIRNNILFGREDIDSDLIEWALEVSQLKGEVETFPDGLETMIGTRGMSISGGQKQRLALARALVGRPKILILDDCTSALDSSTEAALWARMDEVMPELTTILITHRPDTLEQADRIYVLEDGRVVDCGDHQKLVESNRLYARMYRRYQLKEQVAG